MGSYFLALINIHDPAKYEKYLAGFDEVFENYEGQVISVEDRPTVLEGEWPAARTVLIRFPNDQELRRWYESPEYHQLARYRQEASVASIAIISGRDSQ